MVFFCRFIKTITVDGSDETVAMVILFLCFLKNESLSVWSKESSVHQSVANRLQKSWQYACICYMCTTTAIATTTIPTCSLREWYATCDDHGDDAANAAIANKQPLEVIQWIVQSVALAVIAERVHTHKPSYGNYFSGDLLFFFSAGSLAMYAIGCVSVCSIAHQHNFCCCWGAADSRCIAQSIISLLTAV